MSGVFILSESLLTFQMLSALSNVGLRKKVIYKVNGGYRKKVGFGMLSCLLHKHKTQGVILTFGHYHLLVTCCDGLIMNLI